MSTVATEPRKCGRRKPAIELCRANWFVRTDQRDRLAAAADDRGLTVSAIVREVLDRALATEGR